MAQAHRSKHGHNGGHGSHRGEAFSPYVAPDRSKLHERAIAGSHHAKNVEHDKAKAAFEKDQKATIAPTAMTKPISASELKTEGPILAKESMVEIRKAADELFHIVSKCRGQRGESTTNKILGELGLGQIDWSDQFAFVHREGWQNIPGIEKASDKAAHIRGLVEKVREKKSQTHAPITLHEPTVVIKKARVSAGRPAPKFEEGLSQEQSEIFRLLGAVYSRIEHIASITVESEQNIAYRCGIGPDQLDRFYDLSLRVPKTRSSAAEAIASLGLPGASDTQKLNALVDARFELDKVSDLIDSRFRIMSRGAALESCGPEFSKIANLLNPVESEAEPAPKSAGRGDFVHMPRVLRERMAGKDHGAKKEKKPVELTREQEDILRMVGEIANTIYLNCDDAPIEIDEKKLASMFGFKPKQFEQARDVSEGLLPESELPKLFKSLKLPGETPAETKRILKEVSSKLDKIVERVEDFEEFDFKAELTQLGQVFQGKASEAKEVHSFRDLLTDFGTKIFAIADDHRVDPETICGLCGFNFAQTAVLGPYFSNLNTVSEPTSQRAAEAIFLNVSDVPGLLKEITRIADELRARQEGGERLSRTDFARINEAIIRAKEGKVQTADMEMKKGSRVMLRPESEYAFKSKVPGTMLTDFGGAGRNMMARVWARVKWDNGSDGIYREKDLEPAKERGPVIVSHTPYSHLSSKEEETVLCDELTLITKCVTRLAEITGSTQVNVALSCGIKPSDVVLPFIRQNPRGVALSMLGSSDNEKLTSKLREVRKLLFEATSAPEHEIPERLRKVKSLISNRLGTNQ